MSSEDFTVSSIVTGWYFVKEEDTVKLYVELDMYDGYWRSLLFDLDFIPRLFEWFNIGDDLNLMHCHVQCLVRPRFKYTSLGKVNLPYEIVAVRHNIHQEWLYVE